MWCSHWRKSRVDSLRVPCHEYKSSSSTMLLFDMKDGEAHRTPISVPVNRSSLCSQRNTQVHSHGFPSRTRPFSWQSEEKCASYHNCLILLLLRSRFRSFSINWKAPLCMYWIRLLAIFILYSFLTVTKSFFRIYLMQFPPKNTVFYIWSAS